VTWTERHSGVTARLRGVSAVSDRVTWASGAEGTILRTTDGGITWQRLTIPDTASLDFRDIDAVSATAAYVLSIGSGAASRIYKTVDGGAHWTLQFTNDDAKAFYDGMAFWDAERGVAVSDSVDGRFVVLATDDGGETWSQIADEDGMPEALPGEGAFAASGTCLVVQGEKDAWFGTGAGRVFRSTDRGRTWTVTNTPIISGPESAGIFSIAFRDATRGVIVGGDYRKPDDVGATAARTSDGGKTWTLLAKRLPYRSAVAWAKDRWVAVGTSGSHVSLDNGATWKPLDRENYNSIGFTPTGEGWAVGPKGRVATFAK
jgi:photosystem II stability/assembly factor-like uncharacterized protein